MHETTVRFSDGLWRRVQEASRQEGISAAQLVREATLAHMAVESRTADLRRDIAVTLGQFDRRLRQMEETLRHHGLR